MRLVLIEPDIPQNTGGAIRLAACFNAPLVIVGPCGFAITDKAVRRAAMDYAHQAEIARHASLAAFLESPARASGRLILFTTTAETSLWDFEFQESDLLAFGSESQGAPRAAHEAADARLAIPLAPGARSLNVVVAAGVALAAAGRPR